jgi:endonuclease/exonuclease/phosphatase family metal-dependent hydrolase
MQLRVLTFNIWNEQGDPRRFEHINRELRRLAPDLVALQEVVHTPQNNRLQTLLDGTGLLGTHQADVITYALPASDRYGGNAIATRWPHRIVEVLDLRLPDAPDVPWCALAAVVSLPQAGEMLFIAPTTSWRLNTEAARERQVVALTDLDARHRKALPTIIAGDFNATPDSSSLRYLAGLQSLNGQSVYYHDAWSVAGEGPGYTWTAENPNAKSVIDQIIRQPHHRRRVDHVFIGSWDAHPHAHCRIRAATLAFDQPMDGIFASDHFGVVVDLDVDNDP